MDHKLQDAQDEPKTGVKPIDEVSEEDLDRFCQISERGPKVEPMEMDFTLYEPWLSHLPCYAKFSPAEAKNLALLGE